MKRLNRTRANEFSPALRADTEWRAAARHPGSSAGNSGESSNGQRHAECGGFRLTRQNSRVLTNMEGTVDNDSCIRGDELESLISAGAVPGTAQSPFHLGSNTERVRLPRGLLVQRKAGVCQSGACRYASRQEQ